MFLQQAYELTPKSRRSHCTAAVDDRERARRRCKLAHKGQRAPHRPKVVASHPHDEQPRSCVDILDCNRARGSADVLPVQQNNVPSKPCRNKDVPSSPKFSCTASRMTFASNDALSSTLLRVPPSLLLLSPLSPGCRPLPRTSPSKYLSLKRTISGKLCYQSAFLFFLFFSFFFFFLFWLLVWRRHVYVFASCRPGCHRGEGEKNKEYLYGADDSIFAQHGCSWLAHEKALGLLLVRCFCSCLDLSCHPSPLRTPSPPSPSRALHRVLFNWVSTHKESGRLAPQGRSVLVCHLCLVQQPEWWCCREWDGGGGPQGRVCVALAHRHRWQWTECGRRGIAPLACATFGVWLTSMTPERD